MKRIGLGLGCLLCTAVALAAEPVPAKPEAASTPASATPVKAESARPALDLRIRDIREYMSTEDFRALSADREPERNTVIVEARAPELSMEFEEPVPVGLMSLWHAVTKPSQAWRIFVPDLKRPPDGPPDSKIPPPVFRWGP